MPRKILVLLPMLRLMQTTSAQAEGSASAPAVVPQARDPERPGESSRLPSFVPKPVPPPPPQPPAPPLPPAPWSPRETAVLFGQLLGGVAALGLAAGIGLDDLEDRHLDARGGAIVYGPLVAAAAVSAIGSVSENESSFVRSTACAYLGGLLGVVLGAVAAPKAEPSAGDIIGYMAAGGLLGSTVGATVGWQTGKHRRPPPSADAAPTVQAEPLPSPAAQWSELRRRPAAGASSDPAARRLMLPVVTLSF